MFSLTRLMVPLALWSFFILSFFTQIEAITLQTRSISIPHLTSRSSITSPAGNGSIPVNDEQNTQYIANITVGGTQYSVMIDTGSADLWVTGPTVKQTRDLNVSASVQYAVGSANGSVNLADVQFDGYNISNQAYLLVKDSSTFQSNFLIGGIDGLIGLGPSAGSVVRGAVGNSTADSVLDRIFQQSPSTPNFISYLLQRNNDPTPEVTGQFSIGVVIPEYQSITSQSKLPVQVLTEADTKANQHWTIQLDANGIKGPDGNTIKQSSIVPDNGGRLFAIIDSGFSLPQVPRAVSDAIYGRVQGANYSTQYNLWTIPCEQELNISFVMGGVTFPVHPLDTSSTDFGLQDANGKPICAGTFQPITSAFSLAGQFDLILGMSFLRNTYTLLNFGDFIDGSNSTADPYVQLLSVTDPSAAHADFVKARLNGVDTTSQPQYTLVPANKGKKSPIPLSERVEHTEQKAIRYLPEILTCTIGFVLFVTALCAWRYIRRRRARRAKHGRFDDISKPRPSDVGAGMGVRVGGNSYDHVYPDSGTPIYLQNMGNATNNPGKGYGGGYYRDSQESKYGQQQPAYNKSYEAENYHSRW